VREKRRNKSAEWYRKCNQEEKEAQEES